MMTRPVVRAAVAAVAALLAVSCATQKNVDQQTFDKAPLFGMIYDEDNQPCVGVQIAVDGQPGGPMTDIRGRFVVPDLARGDHKLVASKTSYESLSTNVSFMTRTDVLHLTMVSFTQLLDRAQQSLSDLKWQDARTYLKRAQALDPEDAVLRYLYAIVSYRTGDYASAVQFLSAILDGPTPPSPAVYLFLADLHQNKLNDAPSAIADMESYLKLRADPDVEKRLAALKDTLAGQPSGTAAPTN
jgi:tetratricopeptide (TPR) repeat protein